MTESITRIRGTGPSPFGIMLTLLKIRLSSLLSTSPPFATPIFLRLSCLCNSSPLLADLPSTFFQLMRTNTHIHVRRTYTPPCSLSLSLSLFFSASPSFLIPVMHRARLSLSLPPRWWNIIPGISRPTLTFGLLCNQNNNNCFGTFDYSSIRVTADCPKLRVGIARSAAIRG